MKNDDVVKASALHCLNRTYVSVQATFTRENFNKMLLMMSMKACAMQPNYETLIHLKRNVPSRRARHSIDPSPQGTHTLTHSHTHMGMYPFPQNVRFQRSRNKSFLLSLSADTATRRCIAHYHWRSLKMSSLKSTPGSPCHHPVQGLNNTPMLPFQSVFLLCAFLCVCSGAFVHTTM